MKPRSTWSRLALAVTAAAAFGALGAGPTHAGAPIQLGQVSPANPGACGTLNFVQTAVESGRSYEVPNDGTITGWSHKGRDTTPGSGRLQVWRPAGGTNYTLIGRSALETFLPSQINSYATAIPVEAGDLLGFRSSAVLTGCSFAAGPGDLFSFGPDPSDAATGETRDLSTATSQKRLNVAAILDPDTSVALAVEAKKKQRVGKLKISISGGDEAITGEIGGKAVAKKGGASVAARKTTKKIKPKSFSVAAGATKTVGVKFNKNRKSVKKLRKLLKRKAFRKRSTANVRVSASDRAGNSAAETVKIKLKP